jgi:hypothetical protein
MVFYRSVYQLAAFLMISFYAVGAFSQVTHRVLVSGSDLGYVGVVGPNGAFEWKHNEANQTNDSWVLPNGNVVFAYMYGVKIVTPDFSNPQLDKVVWDRPTKTIGTVRGETHSCQPLEGGSSKFLIGESYDTISYIVEVDTTNKEWKRIALPRFGSGTHNQFRQIRKTPQGTYLVTQQTGGGVAFEFDSTGKQLRKFPDGRYCALRLANGNTLIGCGDVGRAIEVDAANNIVWQVASTEISGVTLGFVAALLRLPNGNTMICNWMGHGSGSGAPVIEITSSKQLVWSLTDSIATRVSSIQVLQDKDTVKPGLTSAYDSVPAQKKVTVFFSKTLDSVTACIFANYSINQGITVTSAALLSDKKSVSLTTGSALVSGVSYTLTVSNIKDRAFPPNTIKAGSTISITLPLVNLMPGRNMNRKPGSPMQSVLRIGQSVVSVYDLEGRLEWKGAVIETISLPAVIKALRLRTGPIQTGTHIVEMQNKNGLSIQTIIIHQ